ncbi:MAG: ABC transporter permease [Candidatus Aminicenantes bacterium]|nr:ABC transporter permease [Candidatus Aminicenantes bacterium]
MSKHILDRLALWLLENIVRHRDNEFAVGDFTEIYANLADESGQAAARRWLWSELFRSFPGFLKTSLIWNITMIMSYFKTSLRNMLRNRVLALVNLLGLAVGMACFILIMVWTQDELSFDRFHANKDRLHLLTIHHPSGIVDPNVPFALAPILGAEFPEIVDFTRVLRLGPKMTCSVSHLLLDGNLIKFYEKEIIRVDPTFFTMFSFPFRFGDPSNALQAPGSMVISESVAERYFGHANPLGKMLNLNGSLDFLVTGVVHVPANSVLQFDFVVPLADPMLDNWNWSDPSYVQLDRPDSAETLRTKIAGSLNTHFPGSLPGKFVVDLLPMTKVHLDFGQMFYIRIFTLVAVFILLIACFNYMNLATARSATRSQEVGVRKVVGARRNHLVHQFLGESVLTAAAALILGLVLVKFFLPVLNRLTGKNLFFSLVQPPWMIPLLLGLVLAVGIVAGIYPALLLSAADPVRALKSARTFRSKRSLFRQVTVIGQFALSVLLILSTIAVSKQLSFFRSRPLGIQTDFVISLPLNEGLKRSYTSFKNELLKNPGILSLTSSQAAPFNADYKTSGVEWANKDPNLVPLFRYSISDFDYFETFGLEMAEGRSFSVQFPTDRMNYIVNESAARYMDLEQPLGEQVSFWGRAGTIIGVVKDFHHVSLHREIMPQIFTINPQHFSALAYAFVKIRSADVSATVAEIQRVSEQIAPNFPFEYRFLDEEIGSLYQKEERLAGIFRYFALLAVFISCLGIFGLSAFAVESRTKEIGIRKVLGSSFSGIITLTSREFLKWLILANLLAWPIAGYAMHVWLKRFAYRTAISPFWFVLAGLLSLSAALAPVLYHAVRAARTDPVDALRYE